MSGVYNARVRRDDLGADEGVTFRSATLVENYNRPDMLMIKGRQSEFRGARTPGYGLLFSDDTGARRFSGQLSSVEEDHTGACNLIYSGDLVRLWWRVCYPKPSADWTTAGQNVSYDTINDDAETKLLYYIDRNAGVGARVERRFAGLTLPASTGRGPAGVTSARFDVLGQLVASLAESANLRVEIRQAYPAGAPQLQVVITDTPDLSQQYRFGTARTAPLQVGQWSTKIDLPILTTALSAASGDLTARILTARTDTDAQDLWGQRIEGFVDQRNTTDLTEIQNGLDEAVANGAGPTDVKVELPDNELIRTVPVGARFTTKLGNAVIVDRLRQRTTTIGEDGATKKVTAVFGDPDAGFATPTQRALARERRRVQNLERR